jgi:gluconolactonase
MAQRWRGHSRRAQQVMPVIGYLSAGSSKGRTTMRNSDLAKLLAGAVLALVSLMLAASAQPLPPTSPPQLAPVLPPAHLVDLLTADGMAAFGAQWKHMEVKIIEGPALPNAMPDYKTSYDITPHAGAKGFDDSSWPTLEPKQLLDRRGGGKLSFLWYRTNLTMPAKIGAFETANAKAVLTAYVDDYAEVWVNGEMPRRVGITSPATIQGFNIPNRVVIADAVKAGDKVEIAIFGINGPISVVPPNFVFFRQASVEFYK